MEIQKVTKEVGLLYSPFLGPGVATDIGDVQGSPSEVYLYPQPILIHIDFPRILLNVPTPHLRNHIPSRPPNMTATPPDRIALPPKPTITDILGGSSALASDTPSPQAHQSFNSPQSSAANGHSKGTIPRSKTRTKSARLSFSSYGRGRAASSRDPVSGIVDDLLNDEDFGPKLPTLVPGIRAAYATPLPVLPMVVMCIVSRNGFINLQ